MRDFVLKAGPRRGLEAHEIQDWYDDQQDLIARGEFFFSLNRYLFLATRQT